MQLSPCDTGLYVWICKLELNLTEKLILKKRVWSKPEVWGLDKGWEETPPNTLGMVVN